MRTPTIASPARRMPLHRRFALGYQIGLVFAAVVTAVVWMSTQSGLDDIDVATERSRQAQQMVADARDAGDILAEIADAPLSLSPRSDLRRALDSLDDGWTAVVADRASLPEGIRLQLDGARGLEVAVADLIAEAGAVADAATGGQAALSAGDAPTARRLAAAARSVAERAEVLADVHDARLDGALATMRGASTTSAVVSMIFLVLLVLVLLRPLRRLMHRESVALEAATEIHQAEKERQELTSHLSDGLDAAETEEETHRVVQRVFDRVVPSSPIELLLADPQGTFTSAVAHPRHGSPSCGVDSPWSCPAVRRGRALTYENSESINACPHLIGRDGGACSATCVPLSFMGESMGVIHTTGPQHADPDPGLVDVLGLVASQVAVRIGTLRSFAQVELQASTDVLTGLPNRRATEDHLDKALRSGERVAVAVADLDQFKQLNDKHGHEAGDRALRMFADSIRDSLRDHDWVGRWGGEEFVVILPGMSALQAKAALDRVREKLADACARAEAPGVAVSMGVVDNEVSARGGDLVRLADEALLAAKTQGRDRVVIGPVVAPLTTETAEP